MLFWLFKIICCYNVCIMNDLLTNNSSICICMSHRNEVSIFSRVGLKRLISTKDNSHNKLMSICICIGAHMKYYVLCVHVIQTNVCAHNSSACWAKQNLKSTPIVITMFYFFQSSLFISCNDRSIFQTLLKRLFLYSSQVFIF